MGAAGPAAGPGAGRVAPVVLVAPAPEAVEGMGDNIHRKASTEARTAAETTASDTAAGAAAVEAAVEAGVEAGAGVIAAAGVETTNSPTTGSRSIARARRHALCCADSRK